MGGGKPSEFLIDLPGRGTLVGWEREVPGAARGLGIVPGLGDHADRYLEVGAAVVDRGIAAQSIDLPGHGKSYGNRGHIRSWEDYRASLDAWMDRARAASPARRWSLLGQSMGALVALDWTLRHPDRVDRLILCAPPFALAIRPNMIKVRAAQLLVRVWPGFSQGNMILPSMLTHDQEIVRIHASDPLVHYKISARLFLEFQAMRASLHRRVKELRTPTLLLHGQADPIADPRGTEAWAQAAPKGLVTLRLYPGLLHEVLNEVGRAKCPSMIAGWLPSRRPEETHSARHRRKRPPGPSAASAA
jgi:alpha-beta hydrolase superfamily lysophospholipase